MARVPWRHRRSFREKRARGSDRRGRGDGLGVGRPEPFDRLELERADLEGDDFEVFRFKDEAEFTAFDDKFHKDRKIAAIYALLDDIVESETLACSPTASSSTKTSSCTTRTPTSGGASAWPDFGSSAPRRLPATENGWHG